MVVKRFDVFLINLNPTIGSEIQKTRPCAVISPDEMNRHINTVIIAPMTTQGRSYPTRVACKFQGKRGRSSWIKFARLTRPDSSRRLDALTLKHKQTS